MWNYCLSLKLVKDLGYGFILYEWCIEEEAIDLMNQTLKCRWRWLLKIWIFVNTFTLLIKSLLDVCRWFSGPSLLLNMTVLILVVMSMQWGLAGPSYMIWYWYQSLCCLYLVWCLRLANSDARRLVHVPVFVWFSCGGGICWALSCFNTFVFFLLKKNVVWHRGFTH